MRWIFLCPTSAFNQEMTSWDVSNVTLYASMFGANSVMQRDLLPMAWQNDGDQAVLFMSEDESEEEYE
jgi:Mycoplasma protein of unknown function, DUF285